MKKLIFKRIWALLLTICMMLSITVPSTAAPAVAADSGALETYGGVDKTVLLQEDLPDAMDALDAAGNGYVGRLRHLEPDLHTFVFANADGTNTMRIFDYPVKYVAEDGSTRDISLDIIPDGNTGGWKTGSHAILTSFAAAVADGVELTYEDIQIKMAPVPQAGRNRTAASANRAVLLADEKTVRYPYSANTALEYSLTYLGFKEDIVVHEYTGQTEFPFQLFTNGLLLEEIEGSYFLVDQTGQIRANIGDIIVFTADERNNTLGSMSYQTVTEGLEYVLTIHVDEDFLQDAKTVYPIRIDPSIEINYTNSGDGAIEDVTIHQSTTYTGNYGSLYIGRHSNGSLSRALMRFPTLSLSSIPAANITAAYVELRDLMCQDNESITIDCHSYNAASPSWSESGTTTWSSVGTSYLGTKLDSHLVLYGKGSDTGSGDAQRYRFNILTAAKAWANGTQSPAKGLVFKASSDFEGQTGSSIKYWYKTFAAYNRSNYKPSLTIVYQSGPPITINQTLPSVVKGSSTVLTATTNPSGVTVSWSSSSNAVATINSNGVVTGVKEGNTIITAYCTIAGTTYYAYCVLYVRLANGVYYIQNNSSKRYLTVPAESMWYAANTVCQQAKYTTSGTLYLRQLWKIYYIGNGYYSIRPMYELSRGLHLTGTTVNAYHVGTTDTLTGVLADFRWSIDASTTGYFFKQNGSSNKILTSGTSIATSSTDVFVQTQLSSGYTVQQWLLEPVSSPPSGVILYDKNTGYAFTGTQTKYVAPRQIRLLSSMDLSAAVYSNYTINQDITWKSSNEKIATVSSSGTVTGVSPGTVTIKGTKSIMGNDYYCTYTLTVTEIADGTYFIKNKRTSKYVDIEQQAMNSGTLIHQWGYHGGNSQRWEFSHLGDGYYSIKSVNSSSAYYLGIQNDSTADGTAAVLRTGSLTNGMKWKISVTSSGAYKITPKTGEANNRVLAVGWAVPGFEDNDGIDIEQRDYVEDTNYKDEWYIGERRIFNAAINSYYDLGYCVRYEETEATSKENINQYTRAVADRYYELFGLQILVNNATYYKSIVDTCKGTVTSSNIDALCSSHSHPGANHTDRNNVLIQFRIDTSDSTNTNVYWSGHKIQSIAADGSIKSNISCSSGNCVLMLDISSNLYRTVASKGVLMHEMNHQFGAKDHYHEPTIRDDPTSCKNKPICSDCGDNHRPPECIMNRSKIDITFSDVICSECQSEIMAHLKVYRE